MANILLIEPNYKNKYPPLGLMKISFFHKNILSDYVHFAKGLLLEDELTIWDRVYVTTLFTYEWVETKRTIEHALEVARDSAKVYVGGITATLLPELIRKISNKINIIEGLLNVQGKLGYANDNIIDSLTPDYSILDDIRKQYIYPTENAYLMYMTRGCGMKCGFCAVQKLEPKYVPYISIKNQVNDIKIRYGEKKDLLLMDNNVLLSPCFDQIVDEIKELGFSKGEAFFHNPLTGKTSKRIIDFNQGLDPFLLTENKAKKLAELEISPARIAFDHIEDSKQYILAIKHCAKYGIKNLSNYLLYNSDDFSGKGKTYAADTPKDLYERLRLTLDLKTEINQDQPIDSQISIFSFPMRYIPLNDLQRGYIGANWNPKYLRAVQTILTPTQGKGVSSKDFFIAAFGMNTQEFLEILDMPEHIIASRGHFVTRNEETTTESLNRLSYWETSRKILQEWTRLYNSLGERRNSFLCIIRDNNFEPEIFHKVHDMSIIPILVHYLSESKFLNLLNSLSSDILMNSIIKYCINEFPTLLQLIAKYIYFSPNVPYKRISGFMKIFGKYAMQALLQILVNEDFGTDETINRLDKAQYQAKIHIVDFNLIHILKSFVALNCLTIDEIQNASIYVMNFDKISLKDLLRERSSIYRDKIRFILSGEIGSEYLYQQVDILTNELFQDLNIN